MVARPHRGHDSSRITDAPATLAYALKAIRLAQRILKGFGWWPEAESSNHRPNVDAQIRPESPTEDAQNATQYG